MSGEALTFDQAHLLAKKKSIHFLQIVKEPMPEATPAEVPAAG